VQNIGWASAEPAVFEPYSLFYVGPARTMSTFGDVHQVGPDLATLLGFVAAGRLSPVVDWRGPCGRVAEAAQVLLDRRIAGKAVLDI
jgi:NADPH2:quinone reductase